MAVVAAAAAMVIPVLTAPAAHGDPVAGLTPVPVTSGTTTSGIDLETIRGSASISGTLVDEVTGEPVVRAYVSAYDASGNTWAHTHTGTAGRFTLGSLPANPDGYRVCTRESYDSVRSGKYPGQYALICFPHTYRGDAIPSDAQPVPLTDGEQTDIGIIEVRQAGMISGRVVSAHGNGLGRAKVVVRSLSDPALSFTIYPDYDIAESRYGKFAIGGLPPSPKGWEVCSDSREAIVSYTKPTDPFGYTSMCYKHTPWLDPGGPRPRATPVHVAPGHARTGLHLVSVLAGGVTGRVSFPGGTPVSGFVSVGRAGSAPNTARISGTRLANRRYKVGGLAPGRQKLKFCVSIEGGNYVGHCATRTVRVRSHEYVSGPHLHVTKGLRMSGTVSDFAGNPARPDELEIFAPGDESTPTVVGVDDTGRYRAVGLAPSASGYYVCASTLRQEDEPDAPGSGCFRHGAWSGARGEAPVGAHLVKIKNGSYRTGVDFRLPQSGSISGTVRNADGATVQSDVTVYSSGGERLAETVSSKDDGSYTFLSLAPGNYYVCADPSLADESTDNGVCYQDAVMPPGTQDFRP